jgi:(1->4)-alpha-D-glucan 1-alpha-D-glucosylmutase
LLYQTLVGAFPVSLDRAISYMEKACREARLFTSWTHPSVEYEGAVRHFLEGIFGDPSFSASLGEFARQVIPTGRVNSLAQTLLKLTAPGVPDLYQGCELWDLSLVDPDNRRPVDYGLRRQLLQQLAEASADEIMARVDEGAPKLHLVRRALHLRRTHPDWFGPEAAYEPILAEGAGADHLVAFGRGDRVVTVVPRLVAGPDPSWRSATLRLPGGRWLNVLSGEEILGGAHAAWDLLARFPVALYVRQ